MWPFNYASLQIVQHKLGVRVRACVRAHVRVRACVPARVLVFRSVVGRRTSVGDLGMVRT